MIFFLIRSTNGLTLISQPNVSSHLLHELQHANDDPIWDVHPDLLLWLLYIGGAFVPKGPVRSQYIALLHLNYATRFGHLGGSWPELLDTLQEFIWSEKAFLSHFKALWEETCI